MKQFKLINKEKVLELVDKLYDIPWQELIVAQILKEKIEYRHDVKDITDGDIDFATKIMYDCYLDNDNENTMWNESIWAAINGEYDFEEEEESNGYDSI